MEQNCGEAKARAILPFQALAPAEHVLMGPQFPRGPGMLTDAVRSE